MNWDISTKEGMENSIIWTEQMLNAIKDGGAWAIPRSGTIVRVSHKDKAAHITYMPDVYEPDIEKVLNAAGWTITIERNEK